MSNEYLDATNLAQRIASDISYNIIIIDSASACHIFLYGTLVYNITSYSDGGVDFSLKIRSNGGKLQCDWLCIYDKLEETVWFDH